MDLMLAELERGFRENWAGFRPTAYETYLQQVDEDLRSDLLIRLLCAEIEFNYQPPALFRNESSVIPADDDDDQRVRPSLRLFLLRFPELRSRIDGIIQLSVLEYALVFATTQSHRISHRIWSYAKVNKSDWGGCCN